MLKLFETEILSLDKLTDEQTAIKVKDFSVWLNNSLVLNKIDMRIPKNK